MALVSVTGLTAERMLEIEAASVVGGTIVGDNLVLVTRGGEFLEAGNVRGPAGSSSIDFSFPVASTEWVCTHNLNHELVDVIAYDSSGVKIDGDITVVDQNTISIKWYYPTTGTATIQR